MNSKKQFTRRQRFFQIAHGGICGLGAAALSSGDLFTITVFTYLMVGNYKYGRAGQIDTLDELKEAFIASVIWPYLAWKKLDQDLQSSEPITYAVYVNHVYAGSLTDAEYSAIKRNVMHDGYVYAAQLTNAVKMVFYLFSHFMTGMPILAFWSMLGLAYFEPGWYSSALAVFQQGPEAIREVIGKYVSVLATLWVMSWGITVAWSGTSGFQNKFSNAVTRLIRQRLEIVAEGDVMLLQNTLGTAQCRGGIDNP